MTQFYTRIFTTHLNLNNLLTAIIIVDLNWLLSHDDVNRLFIILEVLTD